MTDGSCLALLRARCEAGVGDHVEPAGRNQRGLLVVGNTGRPASIRRLEWDADLPTYHTAAYFAELKNTPYKRWVELGAGTHFVMLENNRAQFIHEVVMFLEERPQAVD
jgi:hypothetical protein